jgi:hypothetical protein
LPGIALKLKDNLVIGFGQSLALARPNKINAIERPKCVQYAIVLILANEKVKSLMHVKEMEYI